eukprot:7815422-Prorocentrum_lima.AAC.1
MRSTSWGSRPVIVKPCSAGAMRAVVPARILTVSGWYRSKKSQRHVCPSMCSPTASVSRNRSNSPNT